MAATVHSFPKKPIKPTPAVRNLQHLAPAVPGKSLTTDDQRIYVGNIGLVMLNTVCPWYNSASIIPDEVWARFKTVFEGRLEVRNLYRYFLPMNGIGRLPFPAEGAEQGMEYTYDGTTLCRQDIVLLDGKPVMTAAFIGYDLMSGDEPDWALYPSNFETLQDGLNIKAIPLDIAGVDEILTQLRDNPEKAKTEARFVDLMEGSPEPNTVFDLLPGESVFESVSGYLCAARFPHKIQNFEHFARRHHAYIVASENELLKVHGFIGWTPLEEDKPISGLFVVEQGIMQAPANQLLYSLSGDPTSAQLDAATQIIFKPYHWRYLDESVVSCVELVGRENVYYALDLYSRTPGIALCKKTSLLFTSIDGLLKFKALHQGEQLVDFDLAKLDIPGTVEVWDRSLEVASLTPLELPAA